MACPPRFKGVPTLPSLYLLLLLLYLQWQQAVLPEQVNNTAVSANSPAHCAQPLAQPSALPPTLAQQVIPADIKVLSWNIYKASHPQLLPDLQQLAKQANVLLLQEAYDDPMFDALKPYARFSPGYRSYRQQTGLTLLSDWAPQFHCRFYQREPWLRTPKASSVSRYAVANGVSLLVINMHGINFTLGIADYREQLNRLAKLVKLHQGSVIFAGDLNTWSDERWRLVHRTLSDLGMQRVSFTPDHRTTVFGLPLDHIWIRGVTLTSAQTLERTSSDHNPLLVSVHITTEEPGGDKQH
ncbi:endonuclease/exonuclease/phosphatase family protein [Pseudoalteromonas sp. BDTF-M6]|uniref:endonuclease/exonuclease/phosphatase family protein n=1 Tax=Pseudoalteromonas sp. BDTF-M6 TaxID=2796132 RepID=UPI001BAF5F28|nr:endonuclease/exonuclease/phosphatase family protein [Pseudoalteromonas sp. BDTF-M6]MBS3799253.1 endonuclease/exonuclease/phosphatase family protein [Pseudoalteromonas sp. BDTF-M6]